MLTLQLPITDLLKRWQTLGLITPLDRHFALALAQIENLDPHSPEGSLFVLMCALLSQQLSSQHTCLAICQLDLANPMAEDLKHDQIASCIIDMSHDALLARLSQFNAVALFVDNQGVDNDSVDSTCVDNGGTANSPLILDKGNLYLNKYHYFETQVAAKLKAMASINLLSSDAPNLATLGQDLNRLFGAKSSGAPINWQKVATATALTKALAVITGGPGTGKTTTVTKLLLLLLTQGDLTIRLVAPTGKAAARLSESIKDSKTRLLDELTQGENGPAHEPLITALRAIPEEAATLHRLLGVIPNSHRFRHNADNPLRLDLLVIDEASMVDLPMMYKVLSALPPKARLILLGDQDQLASVEAGAVLADICAGLKTPTKSQALQANPWQMRYSYGQANLLQALTHETLTDYISCDPQIGDSLCMLTHSHRFKGDAGIGLLASAVNHADIKALKRVWDQNHSELIWFEHDHEDGKQALLNLSVKAYGQYLEAIAHNEAHFANNSSVSPSLSPAEVISPAEIIARFNQYRILCAMRAGEFGVEGMNSAMILCLKQARLIDPAQEFYLGRPIIIASNDYNLGLFNGDVGLILQDEQQPSRLMAHFIKADGSILKVQPARLPSHDTCFAMTVHKSQGSEFQRVSFVLPKRPSTAQWQLLTKELVYTAITRAKQQFYCLGSKRVFQRACLQATSRASGLAHRLWG